MYLVKVWYLIICQWQGADSAWKVFFNDCQGGYQISMKQKSLLTWEKNKHKKANSKNLQQRSLWLNHLTAMKHWLLGGSVREDGGGGG